MFHGKNLIVNLQQWRKKIISPEKHIVQSILIVLKYKKVERIITIGKEHV